MTSVGYYNQKFIIRTSDEVLGKRAANFFFINGFPNKSKSYIFSLHLSNDGLFDIKCFEDNASNVLTHNIDLFFHFSLISNNQLAKQKYNSIRSLYDLP